MQVLAALAFAGVVAAQQQEWKVWHPSNSELIYGGDPVTVASTTATAGAAAYTGSAAYDPTTLTPPGVPDPAITTNFVVQLYQGGMTNLSIPQSGAFMGFSIEMSVATQILGRNSSSINVPFLNLMSNLKERSGWVRVRVGGNSQESATLKEHLDGYPEGTILAKDYANLFNNIGTPPLEYTADLLTMMSKISDFTNVHWYIGMPFFNTTPFDVSIVQAGMSILGDRLLAVQAGNEPDLYGFNGRQHRAETYAPQDYKNELSGLFSQVSSNDLIPRKQDIWLAPSISAANPNWLPDTVWSTNIIQDYNQQLNSITVERYPNNNCAALYGSGTAINPQDVFQDYLRHNALTDLVSYYATSAVLAVQQNKPLVMFETNTASCSGFPGISDSFAAALWSLDWSLTMAYNNFSAALFHIGGQNSYYNPFTPAPTNQSAFREWTIGPVYYSAMIMAEILGPSNASQVVDLNMNDGNIFTPGWAIYENGSPTKVALLNYVNDPTGAQSYTAAIAIGGGQTGQLASNPASVRVKYLAADSVAQKGNFSWAGQTFGNHFESDGRMKGNLDVQTVQCDQANNVCNIHVPAPGFALVFLTEDGYSAATPETVATFPTTFQTATVNTARVDPSVLATSNGHADMADIRGATSPGSRKSAAFGMREAVPGLVALAGLALGALVVGRR
ncbi:glycoside hydrolase family 79 protein [Amylostereum chailletii]|nr:glycoside hydrolase family 79 protein [Amylostereum chailletii]